MHIIDDRCCTRLLHHLMIEHNDIFYLPFRLVLQFGRLVAAFGHEKQDSTGQQSSQ